MGSRQDIAIVDYGLGNLFSVQQACEHAGLNGIISRSPEQILSANAVILPGVGAFPDAMHALDDRGLVLTLRESINSGKLVLAICLGMHLLMSVSYEFSKSKGLDIVGGRVSRLEPVLNSSGSRSKVPQVGWNTISREGRQYAERNLSETLLAGVSDGAYMYFVHSYYVTPDDSGIVSTTTEYGGARFCSSFSVGNVFACQFHPERSGAEGLKIYRNMTKLLEKRV